MKRDIAPDLSLFQRVPAAWVLKARLMNVMPVLVALLLPVFPDARVWAQSPNPAFPVGTIAAYPSLVVTGATPILQWSIALPDGEDPGNYAYWIREVLLPSGIVVDTGVSISGQMIAPLSFEPGGARFELWLVRQSPVRACLLDSTTVGSYLPMASVTIRSEDPYPVLPRTRADRPFQVDVTVQGLLGGTNVPDENKSVDLLRFAQSYGSTGTGADLDRSQATLVSESPITNNGTLTLTCSASDILGTDPLKRRGEERISVYSLENFNGPASVIDSKSVQIWPVADGSISGITDDQAIGPAMPALTLELNDLYPDSTTWAQVHLGGPESDFAATVLPGSSITLNSPVPENRILQLSDYASAFDSDGLWTMEILTRTPFGTDRLASVSFEVQGLGLTIEGWRLIHFGGTANSGDGADLNDFDHDGIPNLIEFAFGLDPKLTLAGMLPRPRILGGNQVISFSQPPDIKGISYGAEWSASLLPDRWIPIPDTAEAPQHSFSVPTDARSRIFMRLKVSAP